MTSTIFSSKTFPTFYKWALRRNKAVMVVFSVLLSLALVIDLYAMSLTWPVGSDAQDRTVTEYGEIGLATLIIFQCGAVLFTFISALGTFSFLHNKRSTDMFGSIPSTRGNLFLAHLLGGISSVAGPYLLASIIVMGVTARSYEYLIRDLAVFGTGFLCLAAAYAFTALIAYCCGTILDTAIVTIAVNAIYVGTVGLLWGAASEMIPGLDFENIVYSPVFPAFAPYSFCFFCDFYLVDGEMTSFFALLAWNVVFLAGIFALALFAAQRRKSEVAQSGFSVKWLPLAIKAGGSVVAGGIIGCIAALSSSSGLANMAIYTFWYVIIGFAAFFILHVIFSRGLKGKFLPSFIVYAASSVVSLTVIFLLMTGLGIDTYVPQAQNVKSVHLDNREYKDPENIERITQIHKIITEGLHKENDYPYYLGSEPYIYSEETYEYDDYGNYVPGSSSSDKAVESLRNLYPLTYECGFDFEYSKKIGFKTIRSYYIGMIKRSGGEYVYDYEAIENLLREIYNSEEFKRQYVDDIIWDDEERAKFTLSDSASASSNASQVNFVSYMPNTDSYISTPTSYSYKTVGSYVLPTDDEFEEGLVKVLKEDILADKEYYKIVMLEANSGKKSVGDSYLSLRLEYRVREEYWKDVAINGKNWNPTGNIDVPMYYTNTIGYLKAHGIPTVYSEYVNIGLEYIDPVAYVQTSQAAFDTYYPAFAMSGDRSDLKNLTDEISMSLAYMGIMRNGMNDDPEEWYRDHGGEFRTKVDNLTTKMYTDLLEEGKKVFDDTYCNSYMRDQGYEDGEGYFCLADTIIRELDAQAAQMVFEVNKGVVTEGTDPSRDKKDKEAASDTDSGRESDKDKAASDTDKETASKPAGGASEKTASGDTSSVIDAAA